MKTPQHTVSFYITPPILKALHRTAKKIDRSPSWVVRQALSQYLGISPEVLDKEFE